MGIAAYHPSYAINGCGVGWVERSDTHHNSLLWQFKRRRRFDDTAQVARNYSGDD
jgi:hypothetical protein